LNARAHNYYDSLQKLSTDMQTVQKSLHNDPSLDDLVELAGKTAMSINNLAGALSQDPMHNHEGFLAVRSALEVWAGCTDKVNSLRGTAAGQSPNYGWWKKPVWAKDPFYN
jgi:hypothetical protein